MKNIIDEIHKLITDVSSRIAAGRLNAGERFYLSIRPIKSFAWYIGCSEHNNLIVLLETPYKTNRDFILETRSIICFSELIGEKQLFRLSFELCKADDIALFTKVIEDIILNSMQGKEELIASRTIDRFSMWKNMLKSGSYAKKKYKGLLGELIVFNSLLDMFEAKETIECWIGPEAKEKDYSFPEFWLEVKTIKPEKLEVKITSLQQLDSATDGYLVVCKVEEIDTGGITCSSLYEAISTKLGFGYELFAFRNKLEDLGFMPYVLNPIQYKFKLISIDTYAVKDFPDKKFPRLTSTMGHPAIKSVNYTLTLAALEDWRVINE